MPKKKKKKRGAEKEKKVKKKVLDEYETVSYEQQLLDNNRQLARLRSRNKELEDQAEIAKEKLRQLEEDRADVVAHLKRNFEEKVEEARELNERLSALEELRKDELAAFKKKEESMELEYRTMENNLAAEVKLTSGKLNALEDWRLARLDLMEKFEKQEKEISEQEERHKKTLYDAEKSLVIGKAKMQREMEERLTDLSRMLHNAMNIQVAAATKRAVRENIALDRELNEMLIVCRDLETSLAEYKENAKIQGLQSELYEAELKITLDKVIEQQKLIAKQSDDYTSLFLRCGKIERKSLKLKKYESLIEEARNRSIQLEKQVRSMERNLLKTKQMKEEVFEEVRKKNAKFLRLNGILERCKKCIQKALKVGPDLEDNSCAVLSKENFLHTLREILEDVHEPGSHDPLLMEQIECPYAKGSLGLIGPPVEELYDDYDREIVSPVQELNIEDSPPEKSRNKIPISSVNDDSSQISSFKEA